MKSIVYSMRDGEGIKLVNRSMNPFNASRNKDSIHCKVICAGKRGRSHEMTHKRKGYGNQFMNRLHNYPFRQHS
jgi:hypothetical protein